MSAVASKTQKKIKVTIHKSITRASAAKTIERLFRQDKAQCAAVDAREANFIELPKRRGGCIWTKRPNKVHLELHTGSSAIIRQTPQTLKDLKSVDSFVTVANA